MSGHVRGQTRHVLVFWFAGSRMLVSVASGWGFLVGFASCVVLLVLYFDDRDAMVQCRMKGVYLYLVYILITFSRRC